jgi:hypothetical protein
MQSLFSRIIIITSAGLLIFEIIKGEYIVRLDTSNSIDVIIIIVAMIGLFLGIFIPETQTSDSASPDAVTSPVEIVTPAQAQSGEDIKSQVK